MYAVPITVVNMPRRRNGAAARTQALARATQAVARRDAARIEREKRIQAALTDFFHAQAQVERIQAEAEAASEPFEAGIRQAVLTLDGLGETRSGIAELTGLSLPRVRHYLASAHSDGTRPQVVVARTNDATATGA